MNEPRNKLNGVISYFERQAERYQEKCEGSVWRDLRRREMEACMALLEPQREDFILDAGCGAGFYSRVLLKRGAGRVWAADASPAMAAQAEKSGVEKALVGDLSDMRFGTVFDKILSAGMLEFVDSPENAIANLARHLKQGGRLVLLVPRRCLVGYLYYAFHKLHKLDIHLYEESEIEQLCCAAGMRLIQKQRIGFTVAMRFEKF